MRIQIFLVKVFPWNPDSNPILPVPQARDPGVILCTFFLAHCPLPNSVGPGPGPALCAYPRSSHYHLSISIIITHLPDLPACIQHPGLSIHILNQIMLWLRTKLSSTPPVKNQSSYNDPKDPTLFATSDSLMPLISLSHTHIHTTPLT